MSVVSDLEGDDTLFLGFVDEDALRGRLPGFELQADRVLARVYLDRAPLDAICDEGAIDEKVEGSSLAAVRGPGDDDDRRKCLLESLEPPRAVGLEDGGTRVARANEQAFAREE